MLSCHTVKLDSFDTDLEDPSEIYISLKIHDVSNVIRCNVIFLPKPIVRFATLCLHLETLNGKIYFKGFTQ